MHRTLAPVLVWVLQPEKPAVRPLTAPRVMFLLNNVLSVVSVVEPP